MSLISFDQFAFNVGAMAGKTREASKPLHDAYKKATPEQRADLRTRWIAKHLDGQGLASGRILPKPRTKRTADETKAYDKARQDFAYHIVRDIKPASKPKTTSPRIEVPRALREDIIKQIIATGLDKAQFTALLAQVRDAIDFE